jgi:hypothetical protein
MTTLFVIARRRSRRGNPEVYRCARPGRPPTLDRHGPVGPRDDGLVCHCEERSDAAIRVFAVVSCHALRARDDGS